ncbi:DUF3179 domain-containing protein [Methanosarcina sp. KYL-1]|uniref:DUF3179 domain-containing (seleno)protein n=1 Tax=Methanosarcina sp. KYL-1 TaxID=2602068 RepID=UPI00210199F9|nr:DUF3179 domain-containing (seleno)protein [Methanosarcina sp. KYL-1]MCQ1536515.1 DUF3179 domain-containing protein [Methanosarcina sp. KYL-1]
MLMQRDRRVGMILMLVLILAGILSSCCIEADGEEEVIGTTPDGLEIRVSPGGEQFIVEPEKLVSGGTPIDGILSIDNQKYVRVEEADAWVREDSRVHPKTVVFGIEVEGAFKAYRESDLIEEGVIEDSVNGFPIRVERDEAGIVTVTNLGTGEEIVKERDFWFAWYAFHPDTELYEG